MLCAPAAYMLKACRVVGWRCEVALVAAVVVDVARELGPGLARSGLAEREHDLCALVLDLEFALGGLDFEGEWDGEARALTRACAYSRFHIPRFPASLVRA